MHILGVQCAWILWEVSTWKPLVKQTLDMSGLSLNLKKIQYPSDWTFVLIFIYDGIVAPCKFHLKWPVHILLFISWWKYICLFLISINCEANTHGSLLFLKEINGRSSMSGQQRVSIIYHSFCLGTNPVQLHRNILRKTQDYQIYLETRHEKCVAQNGNPACKLVSHRPNCCV